MSGSAEALALQITGLNDREFRTIFSLARLTSGDDVYARPEKLTALLECGEVEAGQRVSEVCQAQLIGPLALWNAPVPMSDQRAIAFTGKFALGKAARL